MITADGYHDWAAREPLPLDRIYPWRNSMKRIYHHSLEGFLGSGYRAYNDPSRHPTGWTGTVALDGTAFQHAPVWAGLAHGGPNANPFGPGWEAEGKDQPLTKEQRETYKRIHADMSAFTGYTYIRDGTNQDFRLVEHQEAAQTACPSGRYDVLWSTLEDEVTQTQYEDLLLSVWSGSEEAHLPRQQRITNALYRMTEASQGRAASVGDKASSALVVAMKVAGAFTALGLGAIEGLRLLN